MASRQPESTRAEKDLGEERGAELSRLTKLFLLRRTQEINNKYLPPKCIYSVLMDICNFIIFKTMTLRTVE